MHVDAAVAGLICTVLWHRFETLLTAKIIEADPQAAEERANLVSNAGTQYLGSGPFARGIWRVAAPARQQTITAA